MITKVYYFYNLNHNTSPCDYMHGYANIEALSYFITRFRLIVKGKIGGDQTRSSS